MQLPRPNTVIVAALLGAAMTLSGCDSIYDRTKGWANDLDAAIGEQLDSMSSARKQAAAEEEATVANETAKAPPLMQRETKRSNETSPGSKHAQKAIPSSENIASPDGTRTATSRTGLKMPPEPLWASLRTYPIQGAEQLEEPDRIATGDSPALPKQPTASGEAQQPEPPINTARHNMVPAAAGKGTAEPEASDSGVQPLDNSARSASVPEGAPKFAIHLSSLSSEEGAKSHWTTLQKAFPGTLRDLVLNVQRADLGERGIFYRVLAGPFVNEGEAKRSCDALKAQRQYCRVTGVEPSA